LRDDELGSAVMNASWELAIALAGLALAILALWMTWMSWARPKNVRHDQESGRSTAIQLAADIRDLAEQRRRSVETDATALGKAHIEPVWRNSGRLDQALRANDQTRNSIADIDDQVSSFNRLCGGDLPLEHYGDLGNPTLMQYAIFALESGRAQDGDEHHFLTERRAQQARHALNALIRSTLAI
jgi:hypothetical protein